MERDWLNQIRLDGLLLATYPESQTEAICLEAVKQNGLALQYVKHQTEAICLEAIKQNPMAFKWVRKQTTPICLEAIKRDLKLVLEIKHFSEPVIHYLIQHHPDALRFLKICLTKKSALELIKMDPRYLIYVEELTEEMLLTALMNMTANLLEELAERVSWTEELLRMTFCFEAKGIGSLIDDCQLLDDATLYNNRRNKAKSRYEFDQFYFYDKRKQKSLTFNQGLIRDPSNLYQLPNHLKTYQWCRMMIALNSRVKEASPYESLTQSYIEKNETKGENTK